MAKRLVGCVVFFMMTGVASAQQPRPQAMLLSGVVVDPTGAVIPGVEVVATLETDSAVLRTATTGSDGRFSIAVPNPGRYVVRVTVPGFAASVQRIDVAPGQTSTLTIRVGSANLPRASRPGGEAGVRGRATIDAPPPPPPPLVVPRPVPQVGTPINLPRAAPPDTTGPAPEGSAIVSVFYATDRARLIGPVLGYGTTRNANGSLDLGRFDVSVPRDHERGTLERPSIWTFWREDPNQHFVITGRTLQTYEDFYADIRSRIQRFERKDAFVFIHGFNVAFEDAVFRTAQFAYDLQLPIAPILYSWPSAAAMSPIAYSTDAESNRWTERHLRWFLEDVVNKTGATRVHLVAHSMGNKALVNVLNMLPDSTTKKFGQIILTAPDVDADTFIELADGIRRSGERATLYASANDLALSASKQLQGGYRRAGDASGGVVVVNGIDTIDVSALKTDFLGHSPQGHGSVISDIFLLFTQGLEPGRRPGLRSAGNAPSLFWQFVP